MTTEAFTERVQALKPRLFRIAYLSCGAYQDCEDAVQEALLKAWHGLNGLRHAQYFETWLIRILINECNRIHRRCPPGCNLPLTDELPAPPEDSVLRDAVRLIEPKYRAPLVLHHLEGYSIREVASMLRITGGAVRWRLEQGRKKLAQSLSEGGAL